MTCSKVRHFGLAFRRQVLGIPMVAQSRKRVIGILVIGIGFSRFKKRQRVIVLLVPNAVSLFNYHIFRLLETRFYFFTVINHAIPPLGVSTLLEFYHISYFKSTHYEKV